MTDDRTPLADLVGSSGGGRFEANPSWINSFGVVFGGVTVAVLLDAWQRRLEPDESLASAHLAFARPLREGAVAIEVDEPAGGRTVRRLVGALRDGGRTYVEGFAVVTRSTGPTVGAPPPLDVPPVEELDEAIDSARTASFVEEHFEIRVARRPSATEPVVHQWVRLRGLAGGEVLPLAAVGILSDLVGTGVFRTATRELEGLSAVKSLDLSLHLSGIAPTAWTLMSITTPPIHDGAATAHATLRTLDGRPVATVAQQVLVHPLPRAGGS